MSAAHLPASPSRSTAPRPLVAGVLLLMAAYGAHAIAGVGGKPLGSFYNLWVHDGLFLLAAAACVVTAVRCAPERGAWLCFAVALGTYAAGEILWTTIFSKQDPEPFPSLSDACWLAFYPSTYAGLVLLVRRHVTSFSPALWVDGLIGGWWWRRWARRWSSSRSSTPRAAARWRSR